MINERKSISTILHIYSIKIHLRPLSFVRRSWWSTATAMSSALRLAAPQCTGLQAALETATQQVNGQTRTTTHKISQSPATAPTAGATTQQFDGKLAEETIIFFPFPSAIRHAVPEGGRTTLSAPTEHTAIGF